MLGWTFSIGSIFGVQVRLHAFLMLMLALAIIWSSALGRSVPRGLMLWVLLLLALAVRETARALVSAWHGLGVRSLLLLPTGGIPTYATPDSVTLSSEHRVQRRLALAGPIANVVFAAVLAGLILTVSPDVNLYESRWVTPEHLLRAAVWINVLLAAVNLLPAWPLDGARMLQGDLRKARAADAPEPSHGQGDRAAGEGQDAPVRRPLMGVFTGGFTLGPAIAVALIVFGLVSMNWWAVMGGLAILLAGQVERQGLTLRSDLDQVRVRDVMLTDYTVLSASATLEDALDHARHSLEDVFPVVRGGTLVGAISRQVIAEALEGGGNSYVQGVMARSFPTVTPDESLVGALNRITGLKSDSAQLVPVVDGDRGQPFERIVGLMTPQSLQRSMSILAPAQAASRAASPRNASGS